MMLSCKVLKLHIIKSNAERNYYNFGTAAIFVFVALSVEDRVFWQIDVPMGLYD